MSQRTPQIYHFQLPCGIVVDGEIVNDIRVRQIKARDRVVFGTREAKKNFSRAISTLIFNITQDFGEGVEKTIERCNSMSDGDKQYVLLQLRKESPFDEQKSRIKCPYADCEEGQSGFDISITSDQIEVVRLDGKPESEDESPVMPIDHKVYNGRICLVLKRDKPRAEVLYALANLEEQEKIFKATRGNQFEAELLMHSLLIKFWQDDGDEEKTYTDVNVDFVGDLDQYELAWLDKVVTAGTPGPRWKRQATCPCCHRVSDIELDALHFLCLTRQ